MDAAEEEPLLQGEVGGGSITEMEELEEQAAAAPEDAMPSGGARHGDKRRQRRGSTAGSSRGASPEGRQRAPDGGGDVTIDAAPPLAELLLQCTARRIATGSLSGDWIAQRLPPYTYLSDLLTPCASSPAIVPVDHRKSLSHSELRDLIFRVDGRNWRILLGTS
jgi:hypothetical protein